jgi:hypothetical protein
VLKQQKFIFSWFWRSEVQKQAGLVSSEVFLLGFQMADLLLPLHMAVAPAVSLCVLIASSPKGTNQIA